MMRRVDQIRTWASALFLARRADRELNDELQFHLEQRIGENLSKRVTPRCARLVG